MLDWGDPAIHQLIMAVGVSLSHAMIDRGCHSVGCTEAGRALQCFEDRDDDAVLTLDFVIGIHFCPPIFTILDIGII